MRLALVPGWSVTVDDVRAAARDEFHLVETLLDEESLAVADASVPAFKAARRIIADAVRVRYGCTPAEMVSILALIDDHPDAVAYDLLRCGLRLRDFPDGGVTWGDLAVLVRAAQPESAIYKSLNPHWQATYEVQLLQAMEHSLRVLIWQRTKNGHKGRDFPEPAYLPWDERPDDGTICGDSMDWDEAAHFLGWEAEMTT